MKKPPDCVTCLEALTEPADAPARCSRCSELEPATLLGVAQVQELAKRLGFELEAGWISAVPASDLAPELVVVRASVLGRFLATGVAQHVWPLPALLVSSLRLSAQVGTYALEVLRHSDAGTFADVTQRIVFGEPLPPMKDTARR